MPISVEKSIYDPKSPDDGLRVLVMRFWPRGIRKDKVDLWYREVGTSKDLIKAWKAGKITWSELRKRYLADLKGVKSQEIIHELAKRARTQKVTLLCGCHDPRTCHRSVLKEQVENV